MRIGHNKLRIRNYRREDLPTLIQIQQVSTQADGTEVRSASAFEAWFTAPERDVLSNAFVITDDDDELNTWGQAGTLEGIEGELVGYTLVQLRETEDAYHLFCEGTVLPQHRRRTVGRRLLIGALNRARIVATDFEFEAEQEGRPVYFEALLPARDPASAHLAAKCEMLPTDEYPAAALRMYRREL